MTWKQGIVGFSNGVFCFFIFYFILFGNGNERKGLTLQLCKQMESNPQKSPNRYISLLINFFYLIDNWISTMEI